MRLSRLWRPPPDPIRDTAFARFTPWSGRVQAGYEANWLGQITDVRFVKGMDDDWRQTDRMYDPAPFPVLAEEHFEWMTMLDAVLEARGRFVMMELGAGYGRWLVDAALALRQAHPGVPSLLIGIEGDAEHYRWMQQHFRNNNLDPAEHRLIHAAVSDRDGEGEFALNDDHAGWWGQWLMRPETPLAGVPNLRTEPVKTYSIETLLNGLDRVDHMDFDIQGAEANAIAAGINEMTKKVRRVFVETHWPDVHSAVFESFRSHGWKCLHCYGFKNGPNSGDQTPFGPVTFQAGVQCWINRRLR